VAEAVARTALTTPVSGHIPTPLGVLKRKVVDMKIKHEKTGLSETSGTPYRYKPRLGRSEEEAYRNLTNDYGKKARAMDSTVSGIPTGISRTTLIIR
jgi:hypothetical protein